MRKLKQTGQEEIGRIKLSNTRELVASIIDAEKLDLRIWVDSNNYKGWTKQGLRFYLFDGNWKEFRKLIDKVDKIYEEIAWGLRGESMPQGASRQTNIPHTQDITYFQNLGANKIEQPLKKVIEEEARDRLMLGSNPGRE